MIIKEQNTNNVIIVGDLNANPNRGRFWSELVSFCKCLSLTPLNDRLPSDTFTYLCPAKSTTSWLDHILCTSHLSDCIQDISVDYDNAIYDHFPLCFNMCLPISFKNYSEGMFSTEKFVGWNKMDESVEKQVTLNIEKKYH